MNSIIQQNKQCYKCGTTQNLHSHHIYSCIANRKLSEEFDLKIWLCGKHHNLSNQGIHFDREFELEVKQMAQEKAMEYYDWTVEEWIKKFGKNWRD